MRTDLIIIGGGITGLSTAYIAAKAGKKVTVLEAGSNFGGLLDTFEVEGARLEKFYHHFFLHDKEMMWLLKDLGLQDEVVFKSTSMGVFRGGKIFGFDTISDLIGFSPLGFLDKLRFGITGYYLGNFCRWQKYENVAALSWFRKWSGPNVTASIWEPLLKVKFGLHYDKVPLAWMVGRMRQRMQSRSSGTEKLGYLTGSLGVLCDRLLEELKKMNVALHSNTPVESMVVEDGSVKEVKTPNGSFMADRFVATIPNGVLAELVQPFDDGFAAKLKDVEYFGAVCTVLELDRPLSPVYWLNVADPGFPFGGVIEQTNFVEPDQYRGTHLAYLSRYFTHDDEVSVMDETALKEHMLKGVEKAFSEFSRSWLKHVHVFKSSTAATVCDLGFSEKVMAAQSTFSNLTVANMMHVYPDERSVNNSIRVAANACRWLGLDVGYIPSGNSLSGQIGL